MPAVNALPVAVRKHPEVYLLPVRSYTSIFAFTRYSLLRWKKREKEKEMWAQICADIRDNSLISGTKVQHFSENAKRLNINFTSK